MLYSIDYHFKYNNFLYESFFDLENEEIILDYGEGHIAIDEMSFDVSTELEQLFVFGVDAIVQNRIIEVSSEFDFGFDSDFLPQKIDCDVTPLNDLCPFKIDISDVDFNDGQYIPDNLVVEDIDDYILDLYFAYDRVRGLPVYYMDIGNYFMLDYRPYQEFDSSYTGAELEEHTLTPEKIIEGNQIRYDMGDLFNQNFYYSQYVSDLRDLSSCENFVEDEIFSCQDNVFHKFIHNENMLYLQTREYNVIESGYEQDLKEYNVSIVIVENVNTIPTYTFFNAYYENGILINIDYAKYDETDVFTNINVASRNEFSEIYVSTYDFNNSEAESLRVNSSTFVEYTYYSLSDQIEYRYFSDYYDTNIVLELLKDNRFQVGIEVSESDYQETFTSFYHGVEALDGWDKILGHEIYYDDSIVELANDQYLHYMLNNNANGVVLVTRVHPSLNQSTFLHPNDSLTNNFISYDDFMSIYDSMPKSYGEFYLGNNVYSFNGVTYDLGTLDETLLQMGIPLWLLEQGEDAQYPFIIE
jgi:hypothetical protein